MGISPDSGYDKVVQYEKHLVFRGNWIESNGWHLINCASCPGVVVENNVLLSTPTSRNPLIAVPRDNPRTIQPDPITTGAIIRNNTIYLLPGSSTVAYGIASPGAAPEGSGHVVGNNAIVMPGGGTCWSRGVQPASAYAFVGNNACFGGTYDATPAATWVSTDPQLASPPTDLTPLPGSPLVGAGTATYAPALDLDGKARPSPPTIGAYER